jgi:hypothetical protein
MLIILLGSLSLSFLALYVFSRYLKRNSVLFFLMLEDNFKARGGFIFKTLVFSLYYPEKQIQKSTILCFKKLGKIKRLGRDGFGNIFIRFIFPNKETCLFLIPLSDDWRMLQGSSIAAGYFMRSFNLSWYGNLSNLEKAVARGTVGNFLQNL